MCLLLLFAIQTVTRAWFGGLMQVQYSIPANDDSQTGVHLIAQVLARAGLEGYEARAVEQAEKMDTAIKRDLGDSYKSAAPQKQF